MVPCSTDIREKLIEEFGQQFEFCFSHGDEKLLQQQLPYADIIIGEPDEGQIAMAPNLEWIQLTWAGTDKYDKMQNLPEGLHITNASGAFGKIISEYVVGNIIAIYRSFPKYWNNKKYKLWHREDTATTIFGKTVLILGTGDIGSNVAHRLKSFDCEIWGIRRQISADKQLQDFDYVYAMDDIEELLPKADIVVGCLPNNPGTAGQLSRARLALLKEDAVLVNIGRGNLIDTEALIEILEAGRLKGVALDVFEVEPLPQDSPLWDMENVLITPHISGPSFGGNKDVENAIWNICIKNLRIYCKETYYEKRTEQK